MERMSFQWLSPSPISPAPRRATFFTILTSSGVPIEMDSQLFSVPMLLQSSVIHNTVSCPSNSTVEDHVNQDPKILKIGKQSPQFCFRQAKTLQSRTPLVLSPILIAIESFFR